MKKTGTFDRMKKTGIFARTLLFLLALVFALPGFASRACGEASLSSYSSDSGWTYVYLGNYPQWLEGGEPETNAWTWSRNKLKAEDASLFTPSPILWRVLEADGNSAYLCSEYVLFAHPLHVNYGEYRTLGKDFSQTDLCHCLNEEFLPQAFTDDEAALLLPDESGLKVSLLLAADLNNKAYGFGTKKTRKGWATEYAIKITNVFVYQKGGGQHTPYWMRDQSSTDSRHGRCTKVDGSIGHIVADRDNEGARPTIRLDLTAAEISGGSGTKTDPFIIVPSGALEITDASSETDNQ